MTVSETTALLLYRPPAPVDANDIKLHRTFCTQRTMLIVLLPVVGFFGIASEFMRISSTESHNSHATHSFHLEESELFQWDDWKDDLHRAQSWVGKDIPSVSKAVQSQVHSDTSQISNWWDGTADGREEFTNRVAENAKRFGNQVKTWWVDATTASERTISDADVADKVNVIDSNFRKWWSNADSAERQWWNATEHQLQIDKKVGVDWLKQNGGIVSQRGSELLDSTKSKLITEKGTATKVGVMWLNATANELGKDVLKAEKTANDWFDSVEKDAKGEVHAASKEAEKLLNFTDNSLSNNRKKVSEFGIGLLNGTEDALTSTERLALKKGAGVMNATKESLYDDEAMAVEQAKKILNFGKSALKGDLTVIEDDEKLLWNKTEEEFHHKVDEAEQKFNLWWTTTKSAAQNDVSQLTATEVGWWNATEQWLRGRVLPGNSGGHKIKEGVALLYLNNSYAYSLLMNGYHWYDYSNDFFLLQAGWDVQINQAYCSVASAAAVMNSFRPFGAIPIDPVYDPHLYATQENLFSNCVQENVIIHNDKFDGILMTPGGLSLTQLKDLLQCYDLNVTAHFVDPANVTMNDVRQTLEEALLNPSKRVIVNFDRHSLGQSGAGHFSPIGSYSKKEDSFLLMDVAKYKYPPVWVPTERLYIALATVDGCGDWQFPKAQHKLESLNRPSTSSEYKSMMGLLKCHKMHRGFLIVQLPG